MDIIDIASKLGIFVGVILGLILFPLYGKKRNDKQKEVKPILDDSNRSVTVKTTDTEFNEQVILNVVTGKGMSFISLYTLLTVFFSLCVFLFVLSAAVSVMASIFGEAQPDDIAAFFKLIASFDFGNTALRNAAGLRTDALISAYAMAVGIAQLVLAVLFGLSLRILKRQRVSQRAVAALLPVRKRGFVPCAEGIYKLCYNNLWTKNRFYCLYPWESLSLYTVDEKRKRIVLKAGKMQMPLIPWNNESELFDGLKAIVFGHLPKERQSLPVKRKGYKWGRVVAAILIIFALQAVFAGWLENATGKGDGTEYCDVGGKIHYTFRTAFSTQTYFYKMHDAKGQAVRKYCELHGIIYVTMHPGAYVPTLSSLMRENKIRTPIHSVMILEMLTLPAIVWLGLLIMALYAGKPRRFRFNVL